jgi:hypothetical protein
LATVFVWKRLMRRLIYISVFFVALLLGTATSLSSRFLQSLNAARPEIPPVVSHEKTDHFYLERYECYCLEADYSLTLYANGRVYYQPGEYLDVPQRFGTLPSNYFEELSALFDRQEFWNQKGDDVEGQGGEKVCVQRWAPLEANTICGYPGKVPANVDFFARAIDEAATHIVWDDQKARKRTR